MGILNFIKSAFSGNEKEDELAYDDILKAAYYEMKAGGQRYWWSLKANEIKTYSERVSTLPDKQKVVFIIKAIKSIHIFYKGRNSYSSDDKDYMLIQITDTFLRQMFRTNLALDDQDIALIITAFSDYSRFGSNQDLLNWPVNMLVSQIEKHIKRQGLSNNLLNSLKSLHSKIQENARYGQEKEQAKILAKIEAILFSSNEENTGIKPTFFSGDDEFGHYANETINAHSETDRQLWFKMMLHAQKASSGKPSKKYTDEIKNLFKEFGADKYKQQLNAWFSFLIAMKEKTTVSQHQYGDTVYNHSVSKYLTPPNIDIIKGFIWSCIHFHDKSTLFNIAQLADRSYRKIPGQGPTAAAIGNACIYVLANTKGLDGVGHLSRLKLRIKQSSTQTLIEKYILEAADEQGVSIHEIEDMAVDDYRLSEAKREYELDGYKAVLEITGVGKTTLSWFKADGTAQKAVPSAVKEKQAVKLKKIKDTIKQVELTVSGQRDRLDRMFKSNRALPGSKFKEFYFDHGLMSYLSHKIIWTVTKDGNKEAVFYLDGKWCDNKNEEVEISMEDDTAFSLWHPVFETVASISTWREFMMQHKIVQPLKQAFREVYILTDAEINTGTYSNRMAAHILKQHQFNSLAKIRGWKYSLMGAFDNGGYNQFASTDLKDYGLRAEFWINEIAQDDTTNDTGIWNYIATDQLRFTDSTTGNVKELVEIPAVLLSEVLRDLDLFVGVASVGNDPNWRDNGGLTGYNEYWQSYSFGDLNELAKTRRSILAGLVPRLKIAKVAELRDKFLVVKGKLRTYKIHIGSTNILMEPNDQYLCIVPDRGKKEMPDNVFLPFEGDSGLSVILSKAMLLADDDKITDKTITSQINRK